MDLLYHQAKYGGDPDRGPRAGCRLKSVMFFLSVCLSRSILNYEVYDNGNAMKQCNFQNNYSTVA